MKPTILIVDDEPGVRTALSGVLRDGQELQLAVVTTTLVGESGEAAGLLLVLDDVTPLIRAQKVAAWREVARRLAHEIKNPLTPIQLSAERMRRHFAGRTGEALSAVLFDQAPRQRARSCHRASHHRRARWYDRSGRQHAKGNTVYDRTALLMADG